MPHLTQPEWDSFLKKIPSAHLLQSTAWGELKSRFGWFPIRLATADCGAQILFRRLPLGFTLGYIPKGPLGTDWHTLQEEIDTVCKKHHCIFLKIEPDWYEPLSEVQRAQLHPWYTPSPQSIQPRRTLIVDLTGGEEAILERMKQKTRYNIRLAEKKDVKVEESTDMHTFYNLMQETGERDLFGVHTFTYYAHAFELFHARRQCALFIASFQGMPLAALMVFAHGETAWYFYGASSDHERQRMPAYLLQWHAIRWAIKQGCKQYDLWGIPDTNETELEQQFTHREDGLWGVYRFKRGFGGTIRRTAGAYDRVYQPLLYRLYGVWLRKRSGSVETA